MLKAQLNDRRSSSAMSGRQGSGGPRKTGGSGGGSSGGNAGHTGGYNNSGRDRERHYSSGNGGENAGVNMQQQENTRNHSQQRFPPLHFRQRAPRQPNSDTHGIRPHSSLMNRRPPIQDENALLPHLQQPQKHYNSYSNGSQQNKPNRYYNGGNRHYNHNQHYYFNNYKGGPNNRPGISRDHNHTDIKQQYNNKQDHLKQVDPDQG